MKLNVARSKSASRVVKAAVAGVALLVLTGSSALAAESGSGTSTGNSDENPVIVTGTTPLCGQITTVPSGILTLTNTGTFTAGANTFNGTTTATITSAQAYSESPAGTFTDTLCTTPGAVSANVHVTGTSGTTTIDCTGSGTFLRVNTTVTATFTVSCTITAGTAVTTSSTLTFTGNELPVNPVGDQYTGIYTQR